MLSIKTISKIGAFTVATCLCASALAADKICILKEKEGGNVVTKSMTSMKTTFLGNKGAILAEVKKCTGDLAPNSKIIIKCELKKCHLPALHGIVATKGHKAAILVGKKNVLISNGKEAIIVKKGHLLKKAESFEIKNTSNETVNVALGRL